ncbi:MAG TPA: CocE/NonD family hydrolase C-terminal non-catalytic domain-containing protein, partial [Chloroflexota bacterium]
VSSDRDDTDFVAKLIDLGEVLHTFPAGHVVQLDVTSSDFPRRARNPCNRQRPRRGSAWAVQGSTKAAEQERAEHARSYANGQKLAATTTGKINFPLPSVGHALPGRDRKADRLGRIDNSEHPALA